MSAPLRCCVPDCAGEWCACAPGTEAEERMQGNLCVLAPAAEVPLLAYCWEHWPAIASTAEAAPCPD